MKKDFSEIFVKFWRNVKLITSFIRTICNKKKYLLYLENAFKILTSIKFYCFHVTHDVTGRRDHGIRLWDYIFPSLYYSTFIFSYANRNYFIVNIIVLNIIHQKHKHHDSLRISKRKSWTGRFSWSFIWYQISIFQTNT